jgi:predicted ATPase
LSRAAYPQAMSLIETALKLVEKLPGGTERSRAELALRTIESTVAAVLHGHSSSQRESAIRRMCELAESIGEDSRLVRALSSLSILHFTRGESARGLELARRCIAMASAIRDSWLLADLGNVAGILAYSCGNLREAASHFESALRELPKMSSAVSPQTGILYGSMIPCQVALNLQQLGRVNEAARAAEESLRYARGAGHLFSLAYAHYAGAFLALRRRQADLARAYSEEAIAVSEEHGFAEWLRQSRFFHGWALAELGQTAEGLSEMEAGIAEIERFGGVPQLQYLKALHAERLARNGKWAEAVPLLNRSLARIKDSGERAALAEILRLKGEVLLMCERPATTEAEKCFREALEVARAQEGKWWELRATVSLARLLRDTNRSDEARTMLSEIYNWFTDGFELRDLNEAKVLLDELSC